MIFTIALFFCSVALAFAMIARKVWLVRSGKYSAGTYEEADWTELSIEAVRQRLIELAKFTAHHSVLLALKGWIIVASWLRRADRAIKERLMRFLHRNGHYRSGGGKPSGFIEDIRAHKEAVVAETRGESVQTATEAEEK